MTDPAIEVNQLSKDFRLGWHGSVVHALVEVSLNVPRGQIFGLLGPNGAGKTTLVKILLGSLYPGTGTAAVNGHDIRNPSARRRVGFLPENHRFPPYQTAEQMLYCFGGLAGLSRSEVKSNIERLLAMVDMVKWRRTRIRKFSKGMAQRLGLAQALLNDPEIIFLDEPTDGVDPIGRREIRDILKELGRQGKTIFLNSHLLAEVESVCDHVAILNKGRLIKTGPVAGLIASRPSYEVETTGLKPEVIEKVRAGFEQVTVGEKRLTVVFDEAVKINELVDLLRQNGVVLVAVTPVRLSLEDSFMQLIKESGEGGRDEQV